MKSKSRYRFHPRDLRFRQLPFWRKIRWGWLTLFLLAFVAGAAGAAYLASYWWPSPLLRQARRREAEAQAQLQKLQADLHELRSLTSRIESLHQAIYQELVPQAETTLTSPSTLRREALSYPLAEDTLTLYLNRAEALMRSLIRAEPILYSPELRSTLLPRSLPCTCREIGAGFGWVLHPLLGQPYQHAGIDLLMGEGEVVRATAEGLVARIQNLYPSEGYQVVIQHTPALATYYYPLQPRVEVGQWVAPGTPIGTVVRLTLSRMPFLHYEVRVNGESVNPLDYLWGEFSVEERGHFQKAFQQPTYGLH
ncbi:MAG: M23 family metallopeptidase [Bacteroidia bacterium]|nr:M23 family metallopeptidase [Bacteroidia bacterium]MDW8088876.1 M23 family metallopeptidase [Bacteroidia bacterium]